MFLTCKELSEGSTQRIFWERQEKYNSMKGRRQMQWHPLSDSQPQFTYCAVRKSGLTSVHPRELSETTYTGAPTKDGTQVELLHIRRTIC